MDTYTNEFEHQNVPVFLPAEKIIHTLMEFSADTENQDESECDPWGAVDLVYPNSAFSDCVALLTSNPSLKEARKRGNLHFEILEVEAGDNIDAVILKGGYLNIEQGIYFYDSEAPIKEIPAATVAA